MGTKYDYSEGATYQSENTPITVNKIPTGGYKIKAISGDFEGEIAFTTSPGVQDYTITIAKPPAYSIIYDKSLASDPAGCLTYAGLCKGFTPMVGGNGNADEGSWAQGNGTLFDAIKLGYFKDSTFVDVKKNRVTGDSKNDCFTRIPKIYQKVTDISDAGDNSKVQLDLSLEPFDGATLHPAFVVDGVEITYKYIGRFLAKNSSSVLKSISNYYPTVSTTRANFRTYAKAHGNSYGLLSYYDWDLVNKLYLLAFKNFNSQVALGYGYTSASDIDTTGRTNGKSWMYGDSSSHTTHISLFGIEDWWGNVYQWIDNYMADSTYIYASNTASPSDSVSDMTAICANPGSSKVNGCPLTCRAGLNDFFIGENSSGSYNSSGMCDKQNIFAGTYIAYVGGNWGEGLNAGAFCFSSFHSLSVSDSIVGARLVHWE